jgi:hypothetical protein
MRTIMEIDLGDYGTKTHQAEVPEPFQFGDVLPSISPIVLESVDFTSQIGENINNGLAEGYPPCCVAWFTFVWWPLASYMFRYSYFTQKEFTTLADLVRGNSDLGYVQCPKCRHDPA